MHVLIHETVPDHWRSGRGAIERSRLVVDEADGTLWLWAHPRLLGHTAGLVWLFAPVADPRHPGDLWGIDARGNLVVVEVKLATRDEEDPFAGFLEHDDRSVFEPEHLFDQWLARFEEEDEWLDTSARTLPPRPMPGVFPYDNQRAVARRWPDLYDRNRSFLADAYIDTVIDYLARRTRPSPPIYYALVVATGRHGAFLGFNAERSRQQLQRRTRRSAGAVGVFADLDNGGLMIVSSRLESI